MPIKTRLDLSIDMHKSTPDVVGELWVRLKELERRLPYNQAFAPYALTECVDYVTGEDNDLIVI